MKKSRTYNTRRVRRGRSYSIHEISELFNNLHPNAVRRWFKAGLPCIDTEKPIRVHGSDLIAFLEARQSRRRHTCKPTEIYCCKCRKPQAIWENTVDLIIRNPKQLNITGLCAVCSTIMNKAGSVRKIPEYQKTLNVQTIQGEHLLAIITPPVMCNLEQ